MSASSSSSSPHVDAKPWLISTAYELRESDQAKTEHKQKLSQRLGVEKRADYLKKVSWIAQLQHEAHELLMSGDYYDNQFTPEEEECVSEILAERCLLQVEVDLLVKESQLKDFRIDPNFPAPLTKHSSNDVVVLRTQPLKGTNTLTLQKWFEWLCAQKDNGTSNQIDNLDYKNSISKGFSNLSSAPTSRTICIGTIKNQTKKTELNDINKIALEALTAVGIDYRGVTAPNRAFLLHDTLAECVHFTRQNVSVVPLLLFATHPVKAPTATIPTTTPSTATTTPSSSTTPSTTTTTSSTKTASVDVVADDGANDDDDDDNDDDDDEDEDEDEDEATRKRRQAQEKEFLELLEKKTAEFEGLKVPLVLDLKQGIDGVAWLPYFYRSEKKRISKHVGSGEGEATSIKRRLQKGNIDTGNLKIEIFRKEFSCIKGTRAKGIGSRNLSTQERFCASVALVSVMVHDDYWMHDNEYYDDVLPKLISDVGTFFRTHLLKESDETLGIDDKSRLALYEFLEFCKTLIATATSDFEEACKFSWRPGKAKTEKWKASQRESLLKRRATELTDDSSHKKTRD